MQCDCWRNERILNKSSKTKNCQHSHLIIFYCMQRNALKIASTSSILNDWIVVKSHLDFFFAASHLVDYASMELLGEVNDELVHDPLTQSSNNKDRAIFICVKNDVEKNAITRTCSTHIPIAQHVDNWSDCRRWPPVPSTNLNACCWS